MDVHKKEWADDIDNKVERHVVFSCLDNVRGLVEWLQMYKPDDDLLNMKPLDDGGIVPHYSGKGRGGEYALSLIHGITTPWKQPPSSTSQLPWMNATNCPTPSLIPGLSVTIITLPFLHTNFALSVTPLPTNSGGSQATQWSISACLGDSSIDMFSVSDLRYLVPVLFQEHEKYQGRTIRISGEKLTLDEVAYQFSDLFGKDVIYSPLTLEEMSMLDIPGAPAFAQMCRYLISPYANHDLQEAKSILALCGRKPQSFEDWLLSHSDEDAFEKVGLTKDGKPIECVAVFNATTIQGESVIKGLLADNRKQYNIRACISGDAQQLDNPLEAHGVLQIQALDPERITIHYVDLDDVQSCLSILEGVDGAFIAVDFYHTHPNLPTNAERQEERHASVMIDACASSGSVKHLILCTMEAADDVENELKDTTDSKPLYDVKARVAAYARTNNVSMTFVILPLYSEHFFHALADKIRKTRGLADESNVLNGKKGESAISASSNEKVVCVSIEELGSAVANIFDSYEVYSGHEVGLITDILSLEEATEIVEEVFYDQHQAEADASEQLASSTTSSYKVNTVAKDLGQMFRCYSKTDAVKQRASIAKTLELVPDAKPFKNWLEENRDNVEFREMLGIR